jgi:hypothetical protein
MPGTHSAFHYRLMVEPITIRRRIELETRLSQILAPDGKDREMRKYSRTESQQLRLKRTKIKLSDFRTVKVIGKGAFGEVCKSVVSASFAINHRQKGSACSESRYRKGVCDEELAKGGDVAARSGIIIKYPERTFADAHYERSSPTFVQNVMYWRNRHLHGLFSCSILSRTLCTCTSSWSSSRVVI